MHIGMACRAARHWVPVNAAAGTRLRLSFLPHGQQWPRLDAAGAICRHMDPPMPPTRCHLQAPSIHHRIRVRPNARRLGSCPIWTMATSCCLRRSLLVEARILDVEHSGGVAVGYTSTTSAGSADISSFSHESALVSFLPDANI
jgi:hypothetical protein